MARQRLMWQLWIIVTGGTATVLRLLRSTQRRPFWQLALTTTPRSCGALNPTDRQRLVWQLWIVVTRGTATLLILLRSTQRRPFWQLAPKTRP